MTKSLLLRIGAAVALIATIPLFHVSDPLLIIFICVIAAMALITPRTCTPADPSASTGPDATHGAVLAVGVGIVRTITAVTPCAGVAGEMGERLITIDVESMPGQKFTGRLRHRVGDPVVSMLRPGIVVLVAFDPVAREQLSLADDMVAVRAAFDQMLIRKGLTTAEHLDLVRRGIKSHGVVTAMRTTGAAREDYREVELHVMVKRPEGGQFPAHETTLIPAPSVEMVGPGSIIETYYRPGDESAIAVCVPRG
jgi:hypothetical protein